MAKGAPSLSLKGYGDKAAHTQENIAKTVLKWRKTFLQFEGYRRKPRDPPKSARGYIDKGLMTGNELASLTSLTGVLTSPCIYDSFTAHAARGRAHAFEVHLSGLLVWPIGAADLASFPSDPRLSTGAVGSAIHLHSTNSREIHCYARRRHATRCLLTYPSAGAGRALPGPA